MNKLGSVIIVVVLVVVVYLVMLLVMPVIVDLASTANTTMATTAANISNYPGSQDFMLSIPWIMWFVPATIGMIIVVVLLRKP